ncbi:MAG: D-2-hydroxyacid dehydrogenase [Longibaculum muris]|uniref:Lactate dehydrogenase-like 2-hydroxyacid dehydrogenase n=1 Tax=Longibaculum muris TaxID=1796628 RepID=A0A4R3Z877_9FIRM|nr:D-2-hydroxyacid dehydrogenase [Longibaculum muris]KXU48987.1 4-phosphoerythronate dehydrogenase [Candidatus Stoquefichus sp. KLE1796]MBS5369229.1 D-2-hydroxyacid dehydrogenase [Coprobacillus cateniformis]MCR1886794.1 D-2-hydroxyacid dehydrogenase [Longibaculum muris]MED9810546.1 D-2-hydroxyacid dehydrogenase [Longibaculum muris]TCW02823.1 lactate dehydrogenase-like 2-hydroxyacid dehydrogenase [Longibaculum muris]
MKIVDKMKDEELGLALLYNFTKGYGAPVPMDLYDIVLPILYHDSIRDEILKYDSLASCLIACAKSEEHFKENLLTSIEDYKTMTSKALGMAMIGHVLNFQIVDQTMCGIALKSSILDLNEAIHLGEMLKGKSYHDVMSLLKAQEVKIVILQSASVGKDVDLSKFQTLGNVVMYEDTKQDEVRERILDAQIVITNKNQMTAEVLEGLTQLKLICLFATGTNNVDLQYCQSHGIKVANVKGYSTDTVAQHTLALLMHLVEKNATYDHFVKSKQYTQSGRFSYFDDVFHDVSSLTWGIVGLGDIGRKVAGIASAMGAKVQYYSTSGRNATSDYQQVNFETLLKSSDIISIHAPLNENTKYLFDEKALRQMKENAYLINVGRGGIIEEEALVKVLNEGHLSGVGLDVFEHEPLLEDDVLYTIKDMSKVIFTPHIGWGSIEARQRCVNEVYENILAFLKGENRNIVNA